MSHRQLSDKVEGKRNFPLRMTVQSGKPFSHFYLARVEQYHSFNDVELQKPIHQAFSTALPSGQAAATGKRLTAVPPAASLLLMMLSLFWCTQGKHGIRRSYPTYVLADVSRQGHKEDSLAGRVLLYETA